MLNKYFLIVYISIVLALTVLLAFKPVYNWDMLPYMAIIQKMDGANSLNKIHSITYADAQKHMPINKYNILIDAKDPYRKKMSQDAIAFNSQLSYYTVKPIYLLVAYLFYKTGFSLTVSTFLPSLVSFFFINLFCFFWINKLAVPFQAKLIILLLICAVTLPLAARSNPDALSCLFLLVSTYFFLESDSLLFVTLFLILSILVRPDNIIIALLMYAIVLAGKWKRKIPLYISIIYLTAMCACYYLIQKCMYNPGWSSLIYHTFVNDTADPALKQTISINSYLKIIQKNIINLKGFVVLIFLIVLFAPLFLFQQLRFKKINLFYIAVTVWLIVKTLLFPALGVRFIIPPVLLFMLAEIKAYEFNFKKLNLLKNFYE